MQAEFRLVQKYDGGSKLVRLKKQRCQRNEPEGASESEEASKY